MYKIATFFAPLLILTVMLLCCVPSYSCRYHTVPFQVGVDILFLSIQPQTHTVCPDCPGTPGPWGAASYLIQSLRLSCHRWGPSALFQQLWRGGPLRGPLRWAPDGGGDDGPRPLQPPGPCGCGKHRTPRLAAGREHTPDLQSLLRGQQGREEESLLWELQSRKDRHTEDVRTCERSKGNIWPVNIGSYNWLWHQHVRDQKRSQTVGKVH